MVDVTRLVPHIMPSFICFLDYGNTLLYSCGPHRPCTLQTCCLYYWSYVTFSYAFSALTEKLSRNFPAPQPQSSYERSRYFDSLPRARVWLIVQFPAV